MMLRRALVAGLLLVVAAGLGWVLFIGLPSAYGPPAPAVVATPPAPVSEDVRKIKVRLFYVDADGTRLTSVEREVPFADQTVAQARAIIDAQLAQPPAAAAGGTTGAQPAVISAIPPGTTLRAIFVTKEGTAFVDLSSQVATAHPGGAVNELLTIYTIVQALTTNLPAVTAVQLLVDGKEVDTLAGHVDIKRPLPRSDEWVAAGPPAGSAATATATTPATTATVAAPVTTAAPGPSR